MLNIGYHIINYKRNFLVNFSQVNKEITVDVYIYIYIYKIFFSKQIKSFHLCENKIKKTTKRIFTISKCKMHFC